MIGGFQRAALETRLGIPILYGSDAVHGHGNLRGATIFPHNIGLGAAGDPANVTIPSFLRPWIVGRGKASGGSLLTAVNRRRPENSKKLFDAPESTGNNQLGKNSADQLDWDQLSSTSTSGRA